MVLDKDFFYLHGDDLLLEFPLVDRQTCLAVGMVGEFVGHFPGDSVFLGNGFRRNAHADEVIGRAVGNSIAWRQFVSGHRHETHAFRTPCDVHMPHASPDFSHGNGDGFQSGGAVPVDGHAGHFHAQGAERDLAANLESLLSFRVGAPDDHVVDQPGVQFGRLGSQVFHNFYREVVGAEIAEAAFLGFSDGRTIGFDNICFHVFLSK